jgi:hypothetical protein
MLLAGRDDSAAARAAYAAVARLANAAVVAMHRTRRAAVDALRDCESLAARESVARATNADASRMWDVVVLAKELGAAARRHFGDKTAYKKWLSTRRALAALDKSLLDAHLVKPISHAS